MPYIDCWSMLHLLLVWRGGLEILSSPRANQQKENKKEKHPTIRKSYRTFFGVPAIARLSSHCTVGSLCFPLPLKLKRPKHEAIKAHFFVPIFTWSRCLFVSRSRVPIAPLPFGSKYFIFETSLCTFPNITSTSAQRTQAAFHFTPSVTQTMI